MDAGTRAKDLFPQYFCAETVLQALAEKLGVESEVIPKVASGFCSGMSRTGGHCGAVTGAVMGLGLVFGRGHPEDSDESRASIIACYERIQDFMDRFTQRFGALTCVELTGCDLATPEGVEKFKQEGVIERCSVFVGEAARMAAEVMDKEGKGVETLP